MENAQGVGMARTALLGHLCTVHLKHPTPGMSNPKIVSLVAGFTLSTVSGCPYVPKLGHLKEHHVSNSNKNKKCPTAWSVQLPFEQVKKYSVSKPSPCMHHATQYPLTLKCWPDPLKGCVGTGNSAGVVGGQIL